MTFTNRKIPAAPQAKAPVYGLENKISFWAFSQRGESHIRQGVPCQDRCAATMVGQGSFLIAAIADGLGSCALSDWGAYVAIETAVGYLKAGWEKSLEKTAGQSDKDARIEELLRGSMKAAYDGVERAAEEAQQLAYAFQSTLTVALYDGRTLYFAHAGDGGIVVLLGDGTLKLASRRQKGKEENSVYPLQSQSTWEFGKEEDTAAFFMATDGVLDSFAAKEEDQSRIDASFLKPMIKAFPKTAQDVKKICLDYYEYMAGKEYRRTVRDDLTLAAAVSQSGLARALPRLRELEKKERDPHTSLRERAEQEEEKKRDDPDADCDKPGQKVQRAQGKDTFLIGLCFVLAAAAIFLMLFFFF